MTALTVLHELSMKPLRSESFYRDISTPLRHGHDIPEGCPRAVELLHLLQLLLLLLSSFHVQPRGFVRRSVFCFFRYDCALSVALRAPHLLRFFEIATQTTRLFRFCEAPAIKNRVCRSVLMSLCIPSISAQGKPHHLPCMQPPYMHNSRSWLLSIWMSLGCTVHRANLLSFETHRLSWPFPCSHTHKPKLSTVSLK